MGAVRGEKDIFYYLKKAGILGGVILTIKYVLPLMIPFLCAFIMVYLMMPFLKRLEKRIRLKKGWLAAIFLLLLSAAFGFLLYLLFSRLLDPCLHLMQNVPHYVSEFCRFFENCCQNFEQNFGFQKGSIHIYLMERAEQVRIQVMPVMVSGTKNCMRFLCTVGVLFGITFISVLLLVGDWEQLLELKERSPLCQWLTFHFKQILKAVGSYLKAQLVIMGLIMVICTGAFLLSGQSYALLKGIGIGFLDMLPFIGTSIVFIPWAVIKVIQGEYLMALFYLGLYGACTLTREFLEPRLIGNQVGILPTAILMASFVGIKIYGISGIFTGPLTLFILQEFWREEEMEGEKRENGL